MKKIMLLAAFFAIAQFAFAQKVKADKVPQAVKTAFEQKFPNVEFEGWEMEDGNYEAEFEQSEAVEMSAIFSPDGKWLATETEIAKTELPAAVLTKLAGKKVKDADKILRADGSVVYEAEVKGSGEMLFDAAGNSVK